MQQIANAFEPRSEQTTTTLYSPILDRCKINTFHLVFASVKKFSCQKLRKLIAKPPYFHDHRLGGQTYYL